LSFEPKYSVFSAVYPEILLEPEAAEFLRLGLTKLRELRRKELVPHLPGKPARYIRTSLLEWMKEQEVQVKTSAPKPEPKRSTTYKINTDKAALRKGILG